MTLCCETSSARPAGWAVALAGWDCLGWATMRTAVRDDCVCCASPCCFPLDCIARQFGCRARAWRVPRSCCAGCCCIRSKLRCCCCRRLPAERGHGARSRAAAPAARSRHLQACRQRGHPPCEAGAGVAGAAAEPLCLLCLLCLLRVCGLAAASAAPVCLPACLLACCPAHPTFPGFPSPAPAQGKVLAFRQVAADEVLEHQVGNWGCALGGRRVCRLLCVIYQPGLASTPLHLSCATGLQVPLSLHSQRLHSILFHACRSRAWCTLRPVMCGCTTCG